MFAVRRFAVAPRVAARGGCSPRWRLAGAGRAGEPLVSPQWLKEHLADPAIVVLDIRSAIDGGGAEAYAKAHIPGAVHSDYDKAGWRVTRNGVPFMLPTVPELEKLIGETGIDEDNHVVVVPAGVHATDFGAAARVYWTLKIAGHPAVSILDGGFAAWQAAAYPVEAGEAAVAEDLHRHARQVACSPRWPRSRPNAVPAARRWSMRARRASLPARRRRRRRKAYGHIPGALNLDSATFYDQATNRLRPKAELAAIAPRAGRPGGQLLQHRPLGGDRLVRAVRSARPQTSSSTTARWSNGPPTRAGRSPPPAPTGTI